MSFVKYSFSHFTEQNKQPNRINPLYMISNHNCTVCTCTLLKFVQIFYCLNRDWYQSGAVLMIPSLTQRLISALYDLSDVTFSLPVDGLDLDEMWPSFVQ